MAEERKPEDRFSIVLIGDEYLYFVDHDDSDKPYRVACEHIAPTDSVPEAPIPKVVLEL